MIPPISKKSQGTSELMNEFARNCPVCNKRFVKLVEFIRHIRQDHKDIPPDKIFEMGKEQKVGLRK